VVTEGWSDQLADLVNSGQVDGVVLSSTNGRWGSGIEFLADVPSLRHLILVNLLERNVEPLQHLTHLQSLTLNAYATSPLDFSYLESLAQAYIEWRPQYRGISSCVNLQDLFLNRYNDQDLRSLTPLTSLQALRLGDSRRISSLNGIRSLPRLRSLGLLGLPRLTSLVGLDQLAPTLEELDITQCRHLISIDQLAALGRLRRLVLAECGKVPSLRPIAGLRALQELFFFGDTFIVDGDLDFIRSLALRDVSFQNRRHYSLRREELSACRP